MNVDTVKQPENLWVLISICIIACLFLSSCGIISDGSGSKNNRSVTLKWFAPERNADGSDLTDLAGYVVYYGRSSYTYSHSVDIGNYTEAVINGLTPGRWCFAVTAYDTSGNESSYSDDMCTIV